MVVVEWPSRVADLLPADRIDVRIAPTGKRSRRITITHHDASSSASGRGDPPPPAEPG